MFPRSQVASQLCMLRCLGISGIPHLHPMQVAASQPRPEPSASNLLMSLSAAQDLSTKAAHTTSAQLYPHMGPTLPYRPLASGTPPLQHAALQGSAVRPAALLAPSAHGWGHSLADGLHDRTSFHAEWSMPEQLPAFSEARAELQQQQQQQPEQAPLQQHDFFAHDPAMLSIWQGQQPASSAPSPFHFKACPAHADQDLRLCCSVHAAQKHG